MNLAIQCRGEPLFHRNIKGVLGAIAASGIPIENITTNAVLLRDEIADLLIAARCEQVTISLNTVGAESYAQMMQTPARNFERVLANVKALAARPIPRPSINLQFLVWKENFRTIPEMYDLARELGADTIFFSGLAFLRPDQKMTVGETAEMIALYERVVARDEYRRIDIINSFEQDLTPQIAAMNARAAAARGGSGKRLARFITRRDLTWREKLAHRRKLANLRRVEAQIAGLDEPCLIGWHSLVIRTNGIVAPCCILQASPLGDIHTQSLRDVWYGERYAAFRRELSRMMREGDAWQHDEATDVTLTPLCGGKECPIKSFYFRGDVEFRRAIAGS
ncbi:MAG TPA: SPASM domain-containing protein [Thermoanaerobaculia bacterium]|nr:SPASM domain-containing protein [Thermoanaerobaculia bacterium]